MSRAIVQSCRRWAASIATVSILILAISCTTESESDSNAESEAQPVTVAGPTVIEDLKIAFELPEGWWQNGDPVRTSYSSGFVDSDYLRDNPEELETGLNMYIHHNLPVTQDTLVQIHIDSLFFHMVSFEVLTYQNEEQLIEWGEGRCGSTESYCDEGRSQLELVRVLEPEGNPFDTGTGVLYEITNAEIPVLAYVYYLVRDQWAYRIKYELTKKDIGDSAYPPMLDSIRFLD